ncbi:MAG TPA: toll/interleukin-1 receptor domain-containing protein, partial [Acidobacteriaceae bacterium]
MGRAIFISYRRDDTEGEAGRLFDDLVRTFGENSVFMDVAGINPGTDFRKAIDENVASCGVLLAMIGPQWATIANSSGQRRLDNENDYVRLEIASALTRNVAVIPVLVHDSKMPHPEQLPDNLKDLS